jgi:hypothetical protein
MNYFRSFLWFSTFLSALGNLPFFCCSKASQGEIAWSLSLGISRRFFDARYGPSWLRRRMCAQTRGRPDDPDDRSLDRIPHSFEVIKGPPSAAHRTRAVQKPPGNRLPISEQSTAAVPRRPNSTTIPDLRELKDMRALLNAIDTLLPPVRPLGHPPIMHKSETICPKCTRPTISTYGCRRFRAESELESESSL